MTTALDYPALTKAGLAGSLALLAAGAIGSWALSGAAVPAWERTLFLDLEILGTLGILVVPLVFGVVLPLVE